MEIVKLVYDFCNEYVTLKVGPELTAIWRWLGDAIYAALQ